MALAKRSTPARQTAATRRTPAPAAAAAEGIRSTVTPGTIRTGFATTFVLPRIGESANYAKFGIEFDRADKSKSTPAGTIYIPLADAEGVTAIVVTLRK